MRFKHFPVLDGLRGIAVLVVMCFHISLLLLPGLQPYAKGGFLGVDIFFVLSGFLITSILIVEYDKTGRIDLKNFYIRRTLRLIPAFWLFLAVLYAFGDRLLDEAQAKVIYSGYNFAFAFFYLMNWHSAAFGPAGNLNHTWSLAIEEQFYVIWSLFLVCAFAKTRTRNQIAAYTAATVGFLILQRALRAYFGMSVNILYYATDTRIDALLIGCLASMAFCWQMIPDRFFSSRSFTALAGVCLLIAAAVLFGFSHDDRGLYYGALSLFSASIAVIILWLVTRQNTAFHKVLSFGPLRWIGQISYGLYLWHYVFYEFAKKTFDSVAVQVFFGVGLGFAVSSLSFYLLEQPILSLKKKFSRTPAPKPELSRETL